MIMRTNTADIKSKLQMKDKLRNRKTIITTTFENV